jgi:hypothetical protein
VVCPGWVVCVGRGSFVSVSERASGQPEGLPAGLHGAWVGGEPTRRGGPVAAGAAGVRYLVVAGWPRAVRGRRRGDLRGDQTG